MNELTAKLLEEAWQDLPAKKQTPAKLQAEAEASFIIWRNYQIEQWAVAVLPDVKLRPASDYYYETELGDRLWAWVAERGFYTWETPICDGEDDDFVYGFVAHCMAVMTWLAFGPDLPQLDYTEAEIEEFFNFKMNYAPRSAKKAAGKGVQTSMF